MMTIYNFLLFILLLSCASHQNEVKTHKRVSENLVIVTIDGLRWQELFSGMDQKLLQDKIYTKAPDDLIKRYQDQSKEIEREKLFPFFWKTLSKEGQIYGNRDKGSFVDTTNPYLLSYPGYNELFTGYPDPKIIKNDEVDNPNENVFEFLNNQPSYRRKVAVFATWPLFRHILNSKRSGILVNTSGDEFSFPGEKFKLLNDLQELSPRPIGYRPDIFTYAAAREYLKDYRPKVLYIALDEPDDMAHIGLYDQYIKSAVAADAMIADLWRTLQSIPEYKGKTTLVVTCDHGRGDRGKASWMHHGNFKQFPLYHIPESNQIWMAFLGPGIPARGEVSGGEKIYQAQMASTLARILGYEFRPVQGIKDSIEEVFQPAK